MFRCMRGAALAALFGLALVAGGTASAALEISGPSIDMTTGGNWVGTYGECAYVVPTPAIILVEIPTGPDLYSENPAQYDATQCVGGPLFDAGMADFRLFRNSESDPAAFTFGFPEAQTRPGAASYSPCTGEEFHATWDNDTFTTDPMNAEIVVKAGGDLTLAFYFVNEDNGCREQDFRLLVNGVMVPGSEGVIGDFADGKYVVYEITGLEPSDSGTAFRLETDDAPGTPNCPPPAISTGVNSHISGMYVSGSSVCTPGECGDGVLDQGEECDDGNDVDGDGCTANCTNEPFCGDGVVDDGEECDDGNTDDDDGCTSGCLIEIGFCGDGALGAGEECDDGNNDDGDGCSANCTNEVVCPEDDDSSDSDSTGDSFNSSDDFDSSGDGDSSSDNDSSSNDSEGSGSNSDSGSDSSNDCDSDDSDSGTSSDSASGSGSDSGWSKTWSTSDDSSSGSGSDSDSDSDSGSDSDSDSDSSDCDSESSEDSDSDDDICPDTDSSDDSSSNDDSSDDSSDEDSDDSSGSDSNSSSDDDSSGSQHLAPPFGTSLSGGDVVTFGPTTTPVLSGDAAPRSVVDDKLGRRKLRRSR